MKTILIIFFALLPDKHWLVPMVSAQGTASRPPLHVGLNVIDDFTEEALDIEAGFSPTSGSVIRTLKQIVGWRSRPSAIRCDNGPESSRSRPVRRHAVDMVLQSHAPK